jgi:hypothetical protein
MRNDKDQAPIGKKVADILCTQTTVIGTVQDAAHIYGLIIF